MNRMFIGLTLMAALGAFGCSKVAQATPNTVAPVAQERSIDARPVLYVSSHAGHFDAETENGVMLSEFETYAQLEEYAQENGYRLENATKKPAIYCGAPTKKGTPCRRRVKKQGDRCYLHKAVKGEK